MQEPGFESRSGVVAATRPGADARDDPERTIAIVTGTAGGTGSTTFREDFDRTVALTRDDSGAVPATPFGGNLLPPGTRLGEFEISGLVGEGGFGIVYRADDHSLGRTVALKEYMPAALAARTADFSVSIKSERVRETFQIGLRSFINEARMLAQFDHPALVKVYRFWEANGTAYMAMPYYDGVTLKHALQGRAEPPDEAWLRRLAAPLLDALELLHHGNCVHRDVSPDNIMLLAGESPVLLDFGAARRVIGDATQALTVILKPGYAPIEQYDEIPGMKQGPWTDIYALAAVLHFAITGKAPAPSVGRLVQDRYQPLAEVAAERYSASFLSAIDRALSPQPSARPQSIAEWRALLDGRETRPEPAASALAELAGTAEAARVSVPASAPRVPTVITVAPTAPLAPRGRGAARSFGVFGVLALLFAVVAGYLLNGGRLDRMLDKVPLPASLRHAPAAPPAAPLPPADDSKALPATPASALAAPTVPALEPPPPVTAATSAANRREPSVAAPEASVVPPPPPVAKPLPRAIVGARAEPEVDGGAPASAQLSPGRPILREALREARNCFAQRRYECTIARARAVLDADPGNPLAQYLIERARKGQEDALNGDWKMH